MKKNTVMEMTCDDLEQKLSQWSHIEAKLETVRETIRELDSLGVARDYDFIQLYRSVRTRFVDNTGEEFACKKKAE